MTHAGERDAAAPRILVLMASRNGEPWIAEQVRSILRQRGVEVRLVVRDDASGDRTTLILDEFIRGGASLSVIRAERPSGSAGANFIELFRGADAADFDFVALADQDDVWLDDKLLRATEQLQSTGADGYSAAVTAFWTDGRQRVLRQSSRSSDADFLLEGAGQGCTFVLRREAFLRVQAFCSAHAAAVAAFHYHDWLIYLLVRSWRGVWSFDQRASMRYRQHGRNEIGARDGWTSALRRLTLLKDGWYRRQVAGALDLYRLTGAAGRIPSLLASIAESPDCISRRVRMMLFVLRHGRRRWQDRAVLAATALCGLI